MKPNHFFRRLFICQRNYILPFYNDIKFVIGTDKILKKPYTFLIFYKHDCISEKNFIYDNERIQHIKFHLNTLSIIKSSDLISSQKVAKKSLIETLSIRTFNLSTKHFYNDCFLSKICIKFLFFYNRYIKC